MRIRPIFKWYDLWVGFYWDRDNRRLYFLPLPMVGICLHFESENFEDGVQSYYSGMRCTDQFGDQWVRGWEHARDRTEILL